MKEILLTEKEMVFLVLSYFHVQHTYNRQPDAFFKQWLSNLWNLKDSKENEENFELNTSFTIYLNYETLKC